jgi:hypothetical protein
VNLAALDLNLLVILDALLAEATVGAGGEWMLVLRYSDIDSAKKAGKSDTGEISKTFMTMIDTSTMSASFHEIVSEG